MSLEALGKIPHYLGVGATLYRFGGAPWGSGKPTRAALEYQ
jgi:hypothetical protein